MSYIKNKIMRPLLRKVIFPLCGVLFSYYIRFVYKTSTVEIIRDPEAKDIIDRDEAVIYAFWHSRLCMMAILDAPHAKTHVLSSKNDINIITESCVKQFGISTIHGSRKNPNKPHIDKGGTQALKLILKSLKAGYNIALTPDGPLGPRQKVHEGVIVASMLSQRPIVATTYVGTKGIYAKTWDRFFLPFPFSKIYYKISKPLYVPKDTSPENIAHYRQKLETIMNDALEGLEQIYLSKSASY